MLLEVLKDPGLGEIHSVEHGFFTRLGGVSEGILSSLNCAPKSADEPAMVKENIRRALGHFSQPLSAWASMRSVHGNRVVEMNSPLPREEAPEADAMVTRVPGVVLASDSADCAMVLFADERAQVVGLAHAGWRGALCGVIEATVEKMRSLGAESEHISAAISPCIAQTSYEVSAAFQEEFLASDSSYVGYFKPSVKAQHFLFDLPRFVKDRLLRLNLKQVSTAVTHDTYSDEKRFFSCRRAYHRQEPTFGGQLSCIFLKAPGFSRG